VRWHTPPVHAARIRFVAPVLLMAAAAARLVMLSAQPLHNLDTYFHLRFGHEFLNGSWSLHHPGSVSTFATARWVPTQWLPEVVMAQTEDWFGLAGVAWLSGLLLLTLAGTVYWVCRSQCEPTLAALLTALTLIACTSGLSMRPQVISYALVAATTGVWLHARKTGRAPWLLVPVTWVWAMCHGMWPVGIVLGAAAVVGLALDRSQPRPALLRMAAVPALSAAAAALTPVGPRLFPEVWGAASRAKYFYEWRAPDYTLPNVAVLLLLLALVVVPWLRRAERAPWLDVALLGVATVGAAYSMRTVPVAACVAAPLAARAVQRWLGPPPELGTRERWLLLAGYLTSLAVLAALVPHTADRPLATAPWLDDELADLPPGTVVVTDTAFGGYLMWRFPQLDLVEHGYGDTFTGDELERNADIAGVRSGWAELLRDTDARYAVLVPGSPLDYNLRQTEHWTLLRHSDDLDLLVGPEG
jgi:hypothetical protein